MTESFLRAFVPEAPHNPATSVACYNSTLEWVPDHSNGVVPDEIVALCRQCPMRAACLQWAVDAEEYGYWAGTTQADRAVLRDSGDVSVSAADAVQEVVAEAAAAAARRVLHRPGQGSYLMYRAGCRCGQCRAAHTALRRSERARTRARALQAA